MRATGHYVDVEPFDVQPGDLATHRFRELDSRVVTKVEPKFGRLYLDILGTEVVVPLVNYTYRRWISE